MLRFGYRVDPRSLSLGAVVKLRRMPRATPDDEIALTRATLREVFPWRPVYWLVGDPAHIAFRSWPIAMLHTFFSALFTEVRANLPLPIYLTATNAAPPAMPVTLPPRTTARPSTLH